MVLLACVIAGVLLLRPAGPAWAAIDAMLAERLEVGVGAAALGPPELAWAGLAPATCMPDRCFCEPVHQGVIRQPVNTWSNLGFVLVGVATIIVAEYDLFQARRGRGANLMQRHAIYPAVYGIVTIVIGLGSMLYHSSLAMVGQHVDVISMYLLTSFMAFYNLSRVGVVNHRSFAIWYLLTNLVLACVAMLLPVLRRYIFLGLVAAVLVSDAAVRRRGRSRANGRFLGGAVIALVLAGLSWALDVTGAVCAPESWLQGHAAWHVFMAIVIGLVYLYFRSERPLQPDAA